MKVSLLALLVLGATGVAIAQNPPPPLHGERGGAQQLDRMATLLDLTDTQKAQVKTVLDAEHAKMQAQFEQAKASGTWPTREQMHAAHEQLKAETIQQLTPVLTPVQLKKFQVLLEDEHGPGGHGPHGPAPADAPPSN